MDVLSFLLPIPFVVLEAFYFIEKGSMRRKENFFPIKHLNGVMVKQILKIGV
jgi:hypothetical protein